MKILIFLFIILINFVSILKADSIKNYQIENMSIGDSALDYFTKKEIRTEKKNRIKYPGSNKFIAITFVEYPKFKIYDSIQINVKKKDKNYIIYSISGINYYNKDIDRCINQLEQISNEVNKIFPDSSNTKRTKKHEFDKSGKSTIHQSIFDMDSGDEVRIECYDWSKKMFDKHDLDDQLVVSIFSEEFSLFITNEAY